MFQPRQGFSTNLFQLLLQPILGHVVQLANLVVPRQIGLPLQCHTRLRVQHTQLHLAVPRGVEDKTHRVRYPRIIVNHFVAVDDVPRLVTGQLFLQVLHRDVVQQFVHRDQLLLAVDFH